ncbi:MAG: tail fiber domain-containing protein [Flavobacterium sp.]
MKKIAVVCFFAFVLQSHSQVGINTTTPNAQLEIKSGDQASPANTDGILIPKVDVFSTVNPTVNQDGMMVYLTTIAGANEPGFYYWDNANSIWKGVGGSKGWSLNGNSGTNAASNFIGTTDYVSLKFRVNNLLSGCIDPALFNTSLGIEACKNNTTGSDNGAFGALSLSSNTTGNQNTAVGSSSLALNTTGSLNAAVGFLSLYSNTTGSRNVAVGSYSLHDNATGSDNVAMGYKCLLSNLGGSQNSAVGNYSMRINTTGSNNTAIGNQSLYSSTTGNSNTALGMSSMYNNTTGSGNVAIGTLSLDNNASGDNNTATGYTSLHTNTTGFSNCAYGYRATFSNTNGSYNSSFGEQSLHYNTVGSGNNAFGHVALFKNTTGTGNGAYGEAANPTTTTGWNNIGIGFHSLGNIDNIGTRILGNEIGYDNVALGLSAGDRTGNNINGCLFLGAFANVTFNDSNLTNATAIGRYATVNQDNTIILGGISGINNAPASTRVGIGTYNPSCPLHVVGSNIQSGSWAYYARNGSATATGFAASTSGNFSIIASDRIQATEFNAVSDARIKDIRNRINPKNALDKINQLQVTDYTYKDWIQKGTAIKTGFIAQEVEKIVPSAVNRSTNYIPNIMQAPHAYCLDSLKNVISINLDKPVQFKKEEYIRLYNRATAIEIPVTKIDDYNFEFIIPAGMQTDDLFVYGTKVDDFRSVDYDQIHTLSVAAVQELSKENELLKQKIQALEQQNATTESRIQKLENALNSLSIK